MAAPINPATGQPFPFLYVITVQRALTRLHELNPRAILSPGTLDGRWGARSHGSYASWLATLTEAQYAGSYIAGLGLSDLPQRVYMPAEGRAILEATTRAYALAHPAEEVTLPSQQPPPTAAGPLPESSAPASPAPVTAPAPSSGVAQNSPPSTRTPTALVTISTPWYENAKYWLVGGLVLAGVAGATWWYFKGRKGARRRRR